MNEIELVRSVTTLERIDQRFLGVTDDCRVVSDCLGLFECSRCVIPGLTGATIPACEGENGKLLGIQLAGLFLAYEQLLAWERNSIELLQVTDLDMIQ